MLNDLAEIIEIESVEAEAEKGAPFGRGAKSALDWFIAKADSYGFRTGELDGYCGYAEIGEGKECIGILCHLDVVPAGKGWSYPPYKLTIDDGYLYGRGVVDNKGSAVIALHVLKKIKEDGVALRNRIRIIAGCNEESGSACLKHYNRYGEIPKMSIVPDADFPIINSEKGILHAEVSIPVDEFFAENIIAFESGNRANVVPDNATCTVKKEGEIGKKLLSLARDNSVFFSPALAKEIIGCGSKPDDFSMHVFEDKIVLESRGISGHAMSPDKAYNASYIMFMLLNALEGGSSGTTLQTVYKSFCNSLALERLGIAFSDEKSGALTMNLGIVKYEKNMLVLTLDFRMPLCCDKDTVLEKLRTALPEKSEIKILRYTPNLYIDADSTLVKTLLDVYCSVTGLPSYTVQTGGGTYARELSNSIAFGPTFPDTVTNIHNIDERISTEQFHKLFEIYYQAVLALDKAE